LDEREFELINIIGAELGSNQRDLSHHMDLSLGQTNMLIRRLIAKGYIRITQLNKKKVRYLLTPKGIAEKMSKSIRYTLKTINSIGLIKEKIKEVVVKSYENGERVFLVLGKSDFAHLIEVVFKEMNLTEYEINYIDEFSEYSKEGTLLICKECSEDEYRKSDKVIDLVRELAKDQTFVNQIGASNYV